MKLKKLVAGVAIAGGGVILVTTLLFKDEIHDWLFAIRRVRTWGDLMAQKPIRLSDGVVVRLGIEDTRCPHGSGVLLYCLTEGYDPGLRDEVSEAALGPLEVAVVEEGSDPDEESSSAIGLFESFSNKGTAPRWLFARSIHVPRPGRYHVTVTEQGTELRRVTVKGTHESTHPWITLDESPDGLLEQGEHFLGTFIPGGSAVIPSWPGFVPCMKVDTPIGVDRELPRLLPDSDAPLELDLRKEKDSLVVTSRSKISLRPWSFAARWWVNGIPQGPRDRSRFSMESHGPRHEVVRFRLALDLAYSGLNVRPGDQVSLQLMYSDQGWSLTDGGEGFFFFSSEEPRVLPSNRVELTLP